MRITAPGLLLLSLLALLATTGCGARLEGMATKLVLTSTAFASQGDIPERHTCYGDNVSPALAWTGAPANARSLALILHDPDSRPAGFIHWVIYGIAPDQAGLPEGVPPQATLADGARQGTNGFARSSGGTFPGGAPINALGYAGPCPPARHHYVFTLYALDATLTLEPGATAADLRAAMRGHILAQTELVGLFTPPG